jgi:glycosyltransferase involved in cell wall biosynthesis
MDIVIVNDGSSRPVDITSIAMIERSLGNVTWIDHAQNRGKGAALRTGIAAAQGELCVFTDIDMPFTVDSMVKVCRSLLGGSNVVLGHRRDVYYDQVPFGRRVISRSFRWLLKYALRSPVTDTQCGLKGFDRRGREVFLRTKVERYLFDLEFILKIAERKDLKIDVVEAELDEHAQFKGMSARVLLNESFNLIKVLVSERDRKQ